MTTPVSQPSPPNWQELIVEAIQQRDASQAVSLAQRYVHRYGMLALDQLLESVNEALGQNGEARSWLLPLLTQPSAQQDSYPAPTAPAPAPAPAQRPHHRQAATLDEAFAPLEIAFPPMPAVGSRAPRVLDAPGAQDSASSPVGVALSGANLVGSERFDAERVDAERVDAEGVDEELIDQGCLDTERVGDQLVHEEHAGEELIDEGSLAQARVDAELMDADLVGQDRLVGELDGVAGVGEAEQNGSSPGPHPEMVLPARRSGPGLFNGEPIALPPPTSLDSLDESVAAPVPTFQLEGASERQPAVQRVRYSEKPPRRYTNRPAPISPALEPWLSWLHGAGPSRPRS